MQGTSGCSVLRGLHCRLLRGVFCHCSLDGRLQGTSGCTDAIFSSDRATSPPFYPVGFTSLRQAEAVHGTQGEATHVVLPMQGTSP